MSMAAHKNSFNKYIFSLAKEPGKGQPIKSKTFRQVLLSSNQTQRKTSEPTTIQATKSRMRSLDFEFQEAIMELSNTLPSIKEDQVKN